MACETRPPYADGMMSTLQCYLYVVRADLRTAILARRQPQCLDGQRCTPQGSHHRRSGDLAVLAGLRAELEAAVKSAPAIDTALGAADLRQRMRDVHKRTIAVLGGH